MSFPNILSILRIFLPAPIIVLFEYDFFILSLTIYIFAAFTDFLDGYFARRNNETSDLGALLDLLADKLFVSTLLIWMTFKFDSPVILVSSILIISREISISYLRLLILSRSKSVNEVKSDLTGKFKTATQMVGLGLILVTPITPDFILELSLILILISVLISWISLINYLNKWIV